MWADRGQNLEEAEGMIRKALAGDPDNGAFLDSLGWLCYKKGELDEALKWLLRAVDNLRPEDATVYDHLADTYQKLGKMDEAVRSWEKALALHQDDLDNKKVQEKLDAAKRKITSAASAAGQKAQ
jgi:tetratricopeptide (TPR) repeat protein